VRRKTPVEKIADAAAETVRDLVLSQHVDSPTGQSPIEGIFFTAFHAFVNYISGCSDIEIWMLRDGEAPEQAVERLGPGLCFVGFSEPVWVGVQTPIGSYRADFTLSIKSWRDKKYRTLVVECDGHNFHERTKEQAAHDRARDRWMVEQGYIVFRFTGSELYRDPVKCAEQVFDMLMKLSSAGGG